MAYTPTSWKDRAVQYAKRYFLRDNGGSDKNLLPPFNEGWTLHENTRMKQANLVAKITASTTENPHISMRTPGGSSGTNTALLAPSSGNWTEMSQGQYDSSEALDANLNTLANTGNLNISQHMVSFNLIEHVLRNYGASVFGVAVTTPERVAWLKLNVAKLIPNWHGYGSSPSGNKAYLGLWNTSSSLWDGVTSHTSGSVTKLTQTSTSMSVRIDANGFFHVICYADPSNGSTASTINTDFVELEVYMAAGSIPQADYVLTVNVSGAGNASDYYLNANPSTAYTLSCTHNGQIRLLQYDIFNAILVDSGYTTNQTLTISSTHASVSRIRVMLSNPTTSGILTFTNPQLELGSSATTFAPMKTYDVTQAPGIVTQAGTPLNAANLNNIETALDVVHDTVDTHVASTNPHSATSAATASRLMIRDASGRVKVAAPSANDDVARLDTVENLAGNFITPQTPVSLGMGGTISPTLTTRATVGNSTYFLGNVSGTKKVLRFDWATKTWTQLANQPASTGAPDSGSNGTYNSTDGAIYFVTYDGGTTNYYVLKYDIAGNTCTTLYTQLGANNNNLNGAVSYYNGKILLLYPGTSTAPYTNYHINWRILNTSGVSQGNGNTTQSLGTSGVPIVPVVCEYQGALLMGVYSYSPYNMYKIVMDATLNTITASTVGSSGGNNSGIWNTQLGGGLFLTTLSGSDTVPGTIRDMTNSVAAIFPPSSTIDYQFIVNPMNTTEFELWKFVADGGVYKVNVNRTYV